MLSLVLSAHLLVTPALSERRLVSLKPSAESISTITLSFEESVGRVGQETYLRISGKADWALSFPFKMVIRFAPSQLEYKNLETAAGLETTGWRLDAELTKAPAAFDMHFLEIVVRPGQQGFFEQTTHLANAYFKILEFPESHPIELSPSLKPLGDQELELETNTPLIRKEEETVFGCFFYMH